MTDVERGAAEMSWLWLWHCGWEAMVYQVENKGGFCFQTNPYLEPWAAAAGRLQRVTVEEFLGGPL